MKHLLLFLILGYTIYSSQSTFAENSSLFPSYINEDDQKVLVSWLTKHPEFKLATDQDCNCTEEIASLQKGSGGVWKANPNYHPYYVRGDFNGDKQTDFAVILKSNSSEAKHTLVVFNGPYSQNPEPAYSSSVSGVLFFGAPRPKPYHLIVGEFNTEGSSLNPKGAGYVLSE